MCPSEEEDGLWGREHILFSLFQSPRQRSTPQQSPRPGRSVQAAALSLGSGPPPRFPKARGGGWGGGVEWGCSEIKVAAVRWRRT